MLKIAYLNRGFSFSNSGNKNFEYDCENNDFPDFDISSKWKIGWKVFFLENARRAE